MALAIVLDAKLRQTACATRLETLLVHAGAAARVLPGVLRRCCEAGVELRGDARTRELFGDAVPATRGGLVARSTSTPILAVRVVDDLDAAIAHIAALRLDRTPR